MEGFDIEGGNQQHMDADSSSNQDGQSVGGLRGVWLRLIGSPRGFPKAFAGDTYVYDLHRASKTKKQWTWVLPIVIIFAIAADWALLSDTFDIAFQPDVATRRGFLLEYLVPVALIMSYLAFGWTAGKKLAEFRSFAGKGALVTFFIFAALELLVLVFLFFLRIYGQMEVNNYGAGGGLGLDFGGGTSSTLQLGGGASSSRLATLFKEAAGFDDEAMKVMLPAVALSLIMCISALLEMYYAYCSYEPFSGEKMRLAQASIGEDRRLYEQVFFDVVNEPKRNEKYETLDRDLDARTVSAIVAVDKIAAQLGGMVDPADAYDFYLARERVNEGTKA